jgi:hypothetical protein
LFCKLFVTILSQSIGRIKNQDLIAQLKVDFFNEIERLQHLKATFVTQKAQAESLMIRDAHQRSACLVCWEQINADELVIWCKICDRYVGHSECLELWLKKKPPTCPHCRAK